MDNIIRGFLERNIPDFKDSFVITLTPDKKDSFKITCRENKIYIEATSYVSAFHGFYCYLKEKCGVQLSWCGNREIRLSSLTFFEGTMEKTIDQQYRVYMNYCTLDYTMCWWDFARWEKEIDFMAMNGINMPLGVVGSEAVLFYTLMELGFTEKEALNEISGPAFWAWQLMTNIMGYMPPPNKRYIDERLDLGKKILERYLQFGMQPIQQGFSGHVPAALKDKFPEANILLQKGWCYYPKTAQLDPTDPLFTRFGKVYLENLERLMGNYHYIACDPFHEGTPPKKSRRYLKGVGRIIDDLYKSFDPDSVWVMQAWTMRKHIIKAVPKDRLFILDLNSEKTLVNKKMWGYPVVSGMLHNFGGKNAMQGQLKRHSENIYLKFKEKKVDVRGTGMFMEGIEQNPVIYDLQFELLTAGEKIDLDKWLDNYISRRYGKYSPALRKAWDILLETCYRDTGYRENEVGSCLASRPQMMPVMTGPCCYAKVYYDTKKFEKALPLFLSVRDELGENDGYQYDLCDITRQCMSNRFHDNQLLFSKAYKSKSLSQVKSLAEKQLELLLDMDSYLSHRSEMCLSRWICDSHKLATDQEQKKYFDLNARTLVTLWGHIDGDTSALYDYSWREWSGLIGEYYYIRWKMFYDDAVDHLERGKSFVIKDGNDYATRKNYLSYDFGKKLGEFELSWCKTYSDYEPPTDSDVIPDTVRLCDKWSFGS